MARIPATLAAFLPAGAVFIADRLSKRVVEQYVGLNESHVVIPHFFNLVHTRNRGAAFGMFAESASAWSTGLLIAFSVLILVFVSVTLWRLAVGRAPGSRTLRLGLSLLLGGALGNIFDRIAAGTVTDFLEIYVRDFRWPAFNVADSAITVGAALLALDLWRARPPAPVK